MHDNNTLPITYNPEIEVDDNPEIEVDDNFIYVSEHGCELTEPQINLNVVPLCPKLDIEYLFHSRYHQLKNFIRRRVSNDADAEDIAQTTYLEAIQKADNFKGLSRPDVWLFGIALNLARNHSKKERNRSRMWEAQYGNESPDYIEEVDNDPCDLVDRKQRIGIIDKTISTLPKEMKQVFKAIFVENQSYQETAKKLGIPTGTVRSRLSRAREKIKGADLFKAGVMTNL